MKKIIKLVLEQMAATQANLSSEYCRELIAQEIINSLKKEKKRRENECVE